MMKIIFENAFMSILDFELTNSNNASACTTGFSRPMPMSAPDLQCRVFPKQQMLSWRTLLVCHSTKLKYVGFVTPLIPGQEKLSSAMSSRIKPPSLIFLTVTNFLHAHNQTLPFRHFWWASKNLIEWIWNIICVQATTNWKKLLEYNDILSAGGPPEVTSFFSMLKILVRNIESKAPYYS